MKIFYKPFAAPGAISPTISAALSACRPAFTATYSQLSLEVPKGLITLRGPSNGCRARYLVTFDGNIAVATGGTVGPIGVAIAVDGEPLYSATAIVTPAAIGDFFNVSATAIVDVPCGCCVSIAVENVLPPTEVAPGTSIDVANASLVVERTA